MEFRYLDISSLDFKKHLDKLTTLINSIDQNAELLDKNMGERIIRLYEYELKCKGVKSLSEFTRKYDRYIYTTNILKALYNHVGLKGSCSDWLRKYRRTNKLELFTTTDVKRYKSNCIKSIKTYKNN